MPKLKSDTNHNIYNGRIIDKESKEIAYFDDTHEYRITSSPLDRYFVKSLSYKVQNEWRVLIDGEHQRLTSNYLDGFLIESTPFEFSIIKRAEDFLNGYIKL